MAESNSWSRRPRLASRGDRIGGPGGAWPPDGPDGRLRHDAPTRDRQQTGGRLVGSNPVVVHATSPLRRGTMWQNLSDETRRRIAAAGPCALDSVRDLEPGSAHQELFVQYFTDNCDDEESSRRW